MEKKTIIKKVIAKLSLEFQKPPKKWWDEMQLKFKKVYPDYDKARITDVIDKIWSDRMTPQKKEEVLRKYR